LAHRQNKGVMGLVDSKTGDVVEIPLGPAPALTGSSLTTPVVPLQTSTPALALL
jgi:hypothetical protein